jgi:hypothetical protein
MLLSLQKSLKVGKLLIVEDSELELSLVLKFCHWQQ